MFIEIERLTSNRIRLVFLVLFTLATLMILLLQSRVAHAASKSQACANGEQIVMGKYYLLNNIWGANTGTGQQCIWDVATNGSSIGWSTRWNWSGQFQVKSYDSVVLGWHWQKQTSAYLTGLPVQLMSNQPVQTSWTYTINHLGPNTTFNIAYDLWLHTNPNPTSDSPSDEVMLWLYKQGNVHPVGSAVATVTINGTSWTLWEGSHSGWNVHTFVRSTNTTVGQSLTLSNFLNYLVSYRGLSNSKYLTGVEAGSEVWLGNAELDSSSYSTSVGSVAGPTQTPSATPSPTAVLPSTPEPTHTSAAVQGPISTQVTPPRHSVATTPEPTSRPEVTPTHATGTVSDRESSGNNWFVVLFFVPVPISIAALISWRRHSRITRGE